MTGSNEPQNIYDDQQFFAGYTQLSRFNKPFGSAMEHAPFLAMAGDVSGLTVLDVGCGAGQLAHRLAEAGAAHVTAFDASERMLAVARTHWAHANVEYAQLTMEDAAYPAGAFDLVVSSLAFHYVEDFESLIRRIAQWLKPGCALVFSTEHPIYAARSTDEGWMSALNGSTVWAIDDYAVEGVRQRRWFVSGVRRYHRTLATILNTLIDAGLVLDRLHESHPSDAWLREHPQDVEERKRPMFLLVKARKPSE